jgi:hypothetical protein
MTAKEPAASRGARDPREGNARRDDLRDGSGTKQGRKLELAHTAERLRTPESGAEAGMTAHLTNRQLTRAMSSKGSGTSGKQAQQSWAAGRTRRTLEGIGFTRE